MDIKKIIRDIKKIDEEYHYFTIIDENPKGKEKTGRLSEIAISVKDNICVKDVESTATSRILKGYKPLFDATVIEKIKNEGGLIIGKTTCDEFGFGSFNVNRGLDYKTPLNPIDKERCTGGSSGGSAGITAKAGFRHVSIAESTGGSIECPAAFCGVIGFCPTYGAVSRYGLISYANSLDKIGLMAKNIPDIKLVFDVIRGKDEKDSTSIKISEEKKVFKKIGVIKESLENVEQKIKFAVEKKIEELKQKGYIIEYVSLPFTTKYALATYYILAPSEASTNLACLSGLRYGQEETTKQKSFSEYFTQIRSKHFGKETKRRILLGTFTRMAGYRDAYYIKATKVRTKIIEEYKKLFEVYDCLITPTMPILPPKFEDIKKLSALETYKMDQLTIGPNLAGIPHLSLPIPLDGDQPGSSLFAGLQLMADHNEDISLLDFAQKIIGKKE